ncbi:3-phosphoshikimate 1-carboxyvinyltransferase [Vaginella massiliensis]|uniref:3-phosphoshikimate 1-carboxyvinyltransferase n=1 Tax=Vaginella massiliensis TaxID=1816680 RepID=UPI0008380877|nr:3-phosphoshikimate 1-carboxyvinyltransferase [Vaginella massiliensis]
MIQLSSSGLPVRGSIQITGSKSESNRLLLLNQLYQNTLNIENLSNAEDTQLMQKALVTSDSLIDIHHAGTAMRFLTAYFAIQENKTVTLTGSDRMKQRPIQVLVEALRALGADISYLEKEGFPPLRISGKKLQQFSIVIPADVSSQYITALMLIGTQLEQGLTIELQGKIISKPYLLMSIKLMNKLGIDANIQNNTISIKPKKNIESRTIQVESDWSSASYYYSIVALSLKSEIQISTYYAASLQGDSALQALYRKHFGVDSTFDNGILHLKNNPNFELSEYVELDMNHTPDIAQTIAVTCVGKQLKCHLTGLETLKIKETDRLQALKNELEKLGAIVHITADSLRITGYREKFDEIPTFETYNDHRMAMCVAPLAVLHPIAIEHPEVVEKSYPDFWRDLMTLGFQLH